MAKKRLGAGVALVAVLAMGATGAQAFVGVRAQSSYSTGARALQAVWADYQAKGVPAAMLDPLRASLAARGNPGWWRPSWWTGNDSKQLDRLRVQTQRVWDRALAEALARAEKVVTDAQDFVRSAGPYAPSGLGETVTAWVSAVQDAATPKALDALAGADSAVLAKLSATVNQEKAAATAALNALGGSAKLLGQVVRLDAVAAADNLDASAMDALAAQMRDEMKHGRIPDDVALPLATAIQDFQATVALNDTVAAPMQQILWDIDQALLEQTPNAQALRTQLTALQQQFKDARTHTQLLDTQQAQTTLQTALRTELDGNRCGHTTKQGRYILISLTLQEMVAYQDGCAVRAAPVTTGRPALPTPPGSYSVFYKKTPFTMVSPWPKSSPYWYPTTPVSWVMEFRSGGYFLHDADWEAPSAYGPGSQDNPYAASHGCIHIPTPTMRWLYDWTPVGTPVDVIA